MASVAILTSTSPLRKTSSQGGVTKQRLNLDAAIQLADKFDVVIVASTAADEVFDHISRNLPRSARMKYRFYGRSFFAKRRSDAADDGRSGGWETILAENRVDFEPIITVRGGPRSGEKRKFDWRAMEDFITDPEVTFVTGGEGQLFYTSVHEARKD
jgi:hypothetical protein